MTKEKLAKERSEWKTKFNRLERKAKEDEEELKSTKLLLEEKSSKVEQLEVTLQRMESEGAKMKEEWAEVERLANEGVARVRSEMTQTVVESEERHRAQLDSLQAELKKEQEQRRQLEEQVEELLENAGMIVPTPATSLAPASVKEARPKRLKQSQGQEEILAGALGLGDMASDDDLDDDDVEDGDESDTGDAPEKPRRASTGNSFAAFEELNSRLKAAKIELNTLRKSLSQSESFRERMADELGECRNAKEKLPLFEAKVRELTSENEEQALEIQALQEDIAEVRELYRSQLNVLIEEKTLRDSITSGAEEQKRESKLNAESVQNIPEAAASCAGRSDDDVESSVEAAVDLAASTRTAKNANHDE